MTHAETCKNCAFAKIDATYGASLIECHREPPRPGAFPRTEHDRLPARWPEVRADDWCGEHRLRPTAP